MNMWASSYQFIQAGLDLLLPPECVNCKFPGAWLCKKCKESISPIASVMCTKCGTPSLSGGPSACLQCQRNPLRYIDGLRSASYFYDSPVKTAIHALKYRNRKVLAPILSEMLAESYHHYSLNVDVIIPVPLHTSRIKERGYNQSELLAKQLSRQLNLPIDTRILYRSRKTESQMTLDAKRRHKNVEDAFSCHTSLINKRILLIDDVCTTGSTLDYSAKPLKANGATSVWGLTLAKAS